MVDSPGVRTVTAMALPLSGRARTVPSSARVAPADASVSCSRMDGI